MKSHSMTSSFDVAGFKSLESVRPNHDVSVLWKRFAQLFNISGLLERMATWLTTPAEPQIYKRRGRNGKVYYRLYDPRTDQRRVFSSEEDIRIWFEQRY